MKQKRPPKSFIKRVRAVGYFYYIKHNIKMIIFMLKLKWS